MPINIRNPLVLKYKKIIRKKFNLLVDFFDFEPGELFIEVLPLEKFKRLYKLEKGRKPQQFVVGSVLRNERIILLDKDDFEKCNHKKNEFEKVITHELTHMFIRRILWPKKISVWIEEGICHFLSFGDCPSRIKQIYDFNELKTSEGWRKKHAYNQSKEFFRKLSNEFGDKKIVEFIKKIKRGTEEQSFKEVFGKDLNKFQKAFTSNLKKEYNQQHNSTLSQYKQPRA